MSRAPAHRVNVAPAWPRVVRTARSNAWSRRARRGVGVVLAALLAACFLVAAWPVAAASTSVSISPATKSVQPGDSFALDVVVNSDTATRGVQFGLTFDPAVVQVSKVTLGSFYQDWAKSHQASASIAIPFTPADNQKGKLKVGGIAILGGPPTDGPTGSGTALTVSLTAKPGASGTAKIAITDVIVSDAKGQQIANPQVTGASVVVGGGGTAAAQPAAAGSTAPTQAPAVSPAAVGNPSPAPASTPAKSTSPTAAPTRAPSPTVGAAARPTDPAPPTAAPGAAAATTAAPAAVTTPSQSAVPTPVPAVAPRGSPGLVIPWEVIGAFGGGVVVTGLVLLALRQAEGGS